MFGIYTGWYITVMTNNGVIWNFNSKSVQCKDMSRHSVFLCAFVPTYVDSSIARFVRSSVDVMRTNNFYETVKFLT